MRQIFRGTRPKHALLFYLQIWKQIVSHGLKLTKLINFAGMNTVHLFTKGAMPDLLHKLKPKILDNDSQNCFKPLPTAEKTLACPDFYKGLIVEIVGDNAVSSALSSDKYSLEMNTTCKSDHLCLARGAIENEIHIAQKRQFLALSPFLGYEAIYMMQILSMCRYFVSA